MGAGGEELRGRGSGRQVAFSAGPRQEVSKRVRPQKRCHPPKGPPISSMSSFQCLGKRDDAVSSGRVADWMKVVPVFCEEGWWVLLNALSAQPGPGQVLASSGPRGAGLLGPAAVAVNLQRVAAGPSLCLALQACACLVLWGLRRLPLLYEMFITYPNVSGMYIALSCGMKFPLVMV